MGFSCFICIMTFRGVRFLAELFVSYSCAGCHVFDRFRVSSCSGIRDLLITFSPCMCVVLKTILHFSMCIHNIASLLWRSFSWSANVMSPRLAPHQFHIDEHRQHVCLWYFSLHCFYLNYMCIYCNVYWELPCNFWASCWLAFLNFSFPIQLRVLHCIACGI